jgi:hypothetical protein
MRCSDHVFLPTLTGLRGLMIGMSRSRRAAALKMLGMTANHVTSFNNEEAFDATH